MSIWAGRFVFVFDSSNMSNGATCTSGRGRARQGMGEGGESGAGGKVCVYGRGTWAREEVWARRVGWGWEPEIRLGKGESECDRGWARAGWKEGPGAGKRHWRARWALAGQREHAKVGRGRKWGARWGSERHRLDS